MIDDFNNMDIHVSRSCHGITDMLCCSKFQSTVEFYFYFPKLQIKTLKLVKNLKKEVLSFLTFSLQYIFFCLQFKSISNSFQQNAKLELKVLFNGHVL